MNIISKALQKIKSIRERNIARRESIARVKEAKKLKDSSTHPDQLDAEALKIQNEYNVSYQDALEYVKSERKTAARKESLQRMAGTLREVGQQAREQSARRMNPEGFITEKPDLTRSKFFSQK